MALEVIYGGKTCRRRHIVPLIDGPAPERPPPPDGVTNERRVGCKWDVSAATSMAIADIKHESRWREGRRL